MALSKILKNRHLLRESLSLWYWTVMMLGIEKTFNALIFAGFKKSSKANIDARQNNWAFRGWSFKGNDVLIIPLVHLQSLKFKSFFFLHRGNHHFTIPQKGMGEWRVENGCTTDSKEKISVTSVFSFGFFP